MCHLYVAMDGGICFISSTVRLVHMAKWPLLVAWSRFFRTGINSAAWYHCANSGLVISSRALSSFGLGGLGGWPGLLLRLTCHMPYLFELLPSNTVRSSFNMLR